MPQHIIVLLRAATPLKHSCFSVEALTRRSEVPPVCATGVTDVSWRTSCGAHIFWAWECLPSTWLLFVAVVSCTHGCALFEAHTAGKCMQVGGWGMGGSLRKERDTINCRPARFKTTAAMIMLIPVNRIPMSPEWLMHARLAHRPSAWALELKKQTQKVFAALNITPVTGVSCQEGTHEVKSS